MSNCTLLHLALGRPMYFKITAGHEATLRMLLATRAIDINARDIRGATALHRSTNRWRAAALQVLLEEEDVAVNAEEESGQTPLH
jgi:ankyrin repeat protein